MTALIYMLAIFFALGYTTEREARKKAEKKIKSFYGDLWNEKQNGATLKFIISIS